MAQLTIDLDEDLLGRIEDAAERERIPVSDWVKRRLLQSLEDGWPPGYSDLFGSLGPGDLDRPPQGDLPLDASRESIG